MRQGLQLSSYSYMAMAITMSYFFNGVACYSRANIFVPVGKRAGEFTQNNNLFETNFQKKAESMTKFLTEASINPVY